MEIPPKPLAAIFEAARHGGASPEKLIRQTFRMAKIVDVWLYILVNGLPHGRNGDRFANAVTVLLRGGWIWAGGVLAGRAFGSTRTREVLIVLLPVMAVTTLLAEHPVKKIFQRQRPFQDIAEALVVGRRPSSWSFPSGHTVSSFAAARVLSTFWPAAAPLFYLLAGFVGMSRVYAGAHYPGDVVIGATLGTVLSELLRLAVLGCLRVVR